MLTLPVTQAATLAELAKLANADFGGNIDVRPMTLAYGEDGCLHALYHGAYMAGDIRVSVPEGIAWPVAVVGASQFYDLIRLFPVESTILLRQEGTTLHVTGTDRKAGLRLLPDDPAEVVLLRSGPAITVAVGALATELGLAANFCSESNQVPILTGVRLVHKGGKNLVLMAHDGRAGLFAGAIPAQLDDGEATTSREVDVTVQAKDLLAALSVLSGDPAEDILLTIELNSEGVPSRVGISSPLGSVVIGTLNGSWPDITAMTAPAERPSITLPADAVSTVVASIKALDAEQVVVLTPVENGLQLSTMESELGGFQIGIAGAVPISEIAFGAQELRLASLLGKSVILEIGEGRIPSVVKAGSRRYWITRRVK